MCDLIHSAETEKRLEQQIWTHYSKAGKTE